MTEVFVQLVTAMMGALGFSLISGMRKQHLLFAALGGMITWGIYLLVHSLTPGIFLASLCAAVTAVIYSEFLARLRKCPSTLFLFPAIIPLVPGSSLYYAMSSIVQGEMEAAKNYGRDTLVFALAIAAGISFATACRELRARRSDDQY